ncbi:MAG: cell envelope integrity protein CreD [Magnetococcales bacterium]|nr:cell envelope integrity protein CreD [Magnetococcales bacterium]
MSTFNLNSTGAKLLVVALLALLLMIPKGMISDVITEREARKQISAHELEKSWGGPQQVIGPILSVPFTYLSQHKSDPNNALPNREVMEWAHFLPDKLSITGEMKPETRKRGIFTFILHQSSLKVSGGFPAIRINPTGVSVHKVLWKDAFLTLGVSHLKGIRNAVDLQWNQKTIHAEPGSRAQKMVRSGVTFPLPLSEPVEPATFAFALDLNGNGGLSFAPVGKETTLSLTSPWPSPSFEGNFLPVNREISPEGFKAQWQVFHLNRDYPQEWVAEEFTPANALFGVSLIQTANHYQQITRTAKYAVLFIAAAFLAFFLMEMLTDKRIHTVQYLLAGLAIVMFYLLLLAISEHSSFGLAYAVAAAAVTLLVGGYSRAMLNSNPLALILVLLLTVLYASLYFILLQEESALLNGTLLLFLLLTITMYLTRRIDWFALDLGNKFVSTALLAQTAEPAPEPTAAPVLSPPAAPAPHDALAKSVD